MVPRIAIHAHLYYPELAPEIFGSVRNIVSVVGARNVRVYATYPEGNAPLQALIRDGLPGADMLPVPNKGYDIGPFFEVLKRIDFSWADFIVKIHTKRDVSGWVNFRLFRGGAWRAALLGFCRTPTAFRKVVKDFERQPLLGMVADRRLIDPSGVGAGHHPEYCEDLLCRLGFEPKGRTIVYGTMFVVRARLLQRFSHFGIDDCDEVTVRNAHEVSGLANACEGAFAMAVESQGYRVAQGRFPAWMSRPYYAVKRISFVMLRKASNAARSTRCLRVIFTALDALVSRRRG